ncbi:MAG TPA: pyridoxamine 5'-phosphate oxidase family protein [Candidatus Dormibacteraeota bacterium]|nr:pyridoxamine 5'-phosphate oxidase family protein [Candidatus Dormibacteraeota bacterium]
MATTTIPDELRDLFEEPALGHVSYLNRRGQIVTYPMWIDFDGEHILVSSPVGSRKGQSLRERGQVAVSVVSTANRWHWVSVSGRVVDIQPDHDLTFIDRMSRKYVGTEYQYRTPREIFTIAIDRVSDSSQALTRWTRSP